MTTRKNIWFLKIVSRYLDDYWFGKRMMMGDTFPHYWNCLTADSCHAYYMAAEEEWYLKAAEECVRNCLCLFDERGCGSAAYVYPYRVNGRSGERYDEWANDQDFALYYALKTGLLDNCCKGIC